MPGWLDLLRQLRDFVPTQYRWATDLVFVIGIGYGLYLAASRAATRVFAWWTRHQRRQAIEKSLGATGIETRPDAPYRFYRPPKLGGLETAEYLYATAREFLGRRDFNELEISSVSSSPETEFLMANFTVGNVRGIEALPSHVRTHVHLELTRKILLESAADAKAIQMVDERLDQLGQNALTRALFGTNCFNAADKTPDTCRDLNYFAKYFQPLMVAFAEDFFEESVGARRPTPTEALLSHLKHLSEKRVTAARLDGDGTPPGFGAIQADLPKKVPRGVAKRNRRREAEGFNRKQASLSVIVVADSDLLDAARRLELQVDRHLKARRSEGFHYIAWTPRVDSEGQDSSAAPCFFWMADDK